MNGGGTVPQLRDKFLSVVRTEHGELCVFVVDLVTSLCIGVVVDYVFCEVRITMLILLTCGRVQRDFKLGIILYVN